MKTKILLNSKMVSKLNELWEKHALPLNISYAKSDRGLTEITFECENKDSILVDWLHDKVTE